MRVRVRVPPGKTINAPILCVLTGREIHCPDLEPHKGYVTFTIAGGTQQDLESLKARGIDISRVK